MPKTMSWLVEKGLRLKGYVNDPLCTPSRADILTGKYTHNHGMTKNEGVGGGEDYFRAQRLDQDTIATRIKAADYRTAYIGKYMNEYQGTYIPPGWNRWFAMVGDYSKESSYTVNSDGTLRTFNRAEHNETMEFWQRAETFVRANKDVPWFCHVGVHSPHGPYYPLHPHAFDNISLYNTPGRGEEDTRTPFVVRGPGVLQGANSPALVGLIDLPPTLCELAGASTDGFDGWSLIPVMDGSVPDTWRKYLYVEHVPGDQFRMLRTNRYVYVEYPQPNEHELYDMIADPYQMESQHRDPDKQALVSEFSTRLAQFKECSGDSCRTLEV